QGPRRRRRQLLRRRRRQGRTLGGQAPAGGQEVGSAPLVGVQPNAFFAARHHLLAQIRFAQHPAEQMGHGRDGGGIAGQDSITAHLGQTGGVAAQHRSAGRERLQQRDAKALEQAEEAQRPRSPEQLAQQRSSHESQVPHRQTPELSRQLLPAFGV